MIFSIHQMNIQIFLFCPVPENQKPINELLQLEENFLNQSMVFSKSKSLWLFFFLFSGIFFFFLLDFKSLFSFFLFTLIWTHFEIITIFFLLFLRWFQVENRFRNSRVFYEEGSWYDGQIWEKPLFLIKNDRFLSIQKIQPILQRVAKTIFFLCFSLLFFLFLF